MRENVAIKIGLMVPTLIGSSWKEDLKEDFLWLIVTIIISNNYHLMSTYSTQAIKWNVTIQNYRSLRFYLYFFQYIK